jgi:hydrogenase maturation protease
MARGKIVILGIGNVLLKDEGVGVHVIREMSKMDLPNDVELVEGGTSSLDLPLYIEEAQKLIIVDALKGGQKPGTIYRCTPEDLMAKGERPTSLHEVGPLEAFRMATRLGYQPTSVIIGVEPESIDWEMDLSPQIKGKMNDIIHAVLKEV